jgi:histidyl-tRNA synthetase
LLINFGVDDMKALNILKEIREKGVNAELYPENAKLAKQMKYADSKNIPYVLFLGEEELTSGQLKLKNMASGEQVNVSVEDVIKKMKN